MLKHWCSFDNIHFCYMQYVTLKIKIYEYLKSAQSNLAINMLLATVSELWAKWAQSRALEKLGR